MLFLHCVRQALFPHTGSPFRGALAISTDSYIVTISRSAEERGAYAIHAAAIFITTSFIASALSCLRVLVANCSIFQFDAGTSIDVDLEKCTSRSTSDSKLENQLPERNAIVLLHLLFSHHHNISRPSFDDKKSRAPPAPMVTDKKLEPMHPIKVAMTKSRKGTDVVPPNK